MNIDSIQKLHCIILPEKYLRFLSDINNGNEYYFNEHVVEDPDFEGRCWWFFDEVALSKDIEMFQVGHAPTHQQLILYLKIFQEFSNDDFVHSNDGKISTNRVSNGFVIAEENGDLLYLDPEDNCSVWIFYHDGNDVMKVSDSFEKWLSKATLA
ncbi:MAG: SMI1/KNR4 family protein [Alphaproteobacteria bacterium]|nr:MAG: SMI1/KNR4 family protein [Alphaproteobacteria bacterium]